MKVAATQFSLKKVHKAQEFWDRFEAILDQAQSQNVEAVVFPEYFSLSLMMCEAREQGLSFSDALKKSRIHSEAVLQKAKDLAQKKKLAIVLGTLPWVEGEQMVNRCFFVSENGESLSQDKIFMTRFEDEIWSVRGGLPSVKVFEWKGITCAILTCYDSEFAVLSQSLARAQVELLFVPSCTDTENGYWRVRHCCEARAVENQLFVVMSHVVDGDKDYEEIDVHHGQAAIFSPCDTGFSASGLVAEGAKNQEGLCVGDLDIQKIKTVRESGSVFNLRDALKLPQIEVVNTQFAGEV